jgi:hypothetical protein
LATFKELAKMGCYYCSSLEGTLFYCISLIANFFASDYCYDIEMKRAIERHELGEAIVLPIILTPVEGWKHSPFAKLQVLPKDGNPVAKWDNRDDAFVNVVQGIRIAIESLSQANPVMQVDSEQVRSPIGSNQGLLEEDPSSYESSIAEVKTVVDPFNNTSAKINEG